MSKMKDLEHEIFEYLDDLRDSGRVNMHTSPEYVMQAFDLSGEEANKAVAKWMDTYTERHGGYTTVSLHDILDKIINGPNRQDHWGDGR